MKIRKDQLDTRICDHRSDSMNPQTYREYIRECEQQFELKPLDLEKESAKKINMYLDWLDDLWLK